MTRARKTLIALKSTSLYHICVCAVRQSFLCGEDRHSGRNFDHRKQWVDLSVYAILSNHYRVILHVYKARTATWDATEIINRWHQLFKGTIQSQAYIKGENPEGADRQLLDSQTGEWEKRLSDISWFMRVINEKIARHANRLPGAC
jgi:hypothetical protein